MTPLHFCNHVGCKALVPLNEKYCAKHEKKLPKRQNSWSYSYRKQIYGKYGRFYHSKRWTRVSKNYRSKHPLCVECLKDGRYTKAQVVDHIIPIRTKQGWSKRWDESNYQSLCVSCHNYKSKIDILKYNLKPVAEENYK